jgi:hypothetical protein
MRRQRHLESLPQRDDDAGMVIVVVGQQDISWPGPVKRGDYFGSPGRRVDYQAFPCPSANDDVGVGLPGPQGQLIDADNAVINDGGDDRLPFARRD